MPRQLDRVFGWRERGAVTRGTAAIILGTNVAAIDDMRGKGILRTLQAGRRVLIPVRDIRRFLKEAGGIVLAELPHSPLSKYSCLEEITSHRVVSEARYFRDYERFSAESQAEARKYLESLYWREAVEREYEREHERTRQKGPSE